MTILARIAGLFLILIALTWGALGLLAVGGGVFLRQLIDQYAPGSSNANAVNNAGDVLGGALAVVGITILVLALIEILAGLGIIFGKGFARFLGILYSLVFGLFLLLGITSGMQNRDVSVDVDSGVRIFFIVILAMFVMYVYSLIVLILRWRGPARA